MLTMEHVKRKLDWDLTRDLGADSGSGCIFVFAFRSRFQSTYINNTLSVMNLYWAVKFKKEIYLTINIRHCGEIFTNSQ